MKHLKSYKIFESVSIPDFLYHGSNVDIKKFQYKKLNPNDDHISSYWGFGIYFTDDLDLAKRYGKNIYKVKINPDANLLHDKVTKEQSESIFNQMLKDKWLLEDPDDPDRIDRITDWFLNPDYKDHSVWTDINEFYDFLLQRPALFGKRDVKDVSDMLLRAGIDGLWVKNDVEDNIFVIFNDKIITIIK